MIASWVICNNGVLKVLEVHHDVDDTLTLQVNEMEPFSATIYYDEEGEPYVNALGARYYLSEAMRA
jgi:hypothetical protein